MSFLSGILSVGKSVVGFLSGSSIASSLAKTALMGYALNRLSSNATKGNDIGATPNIDQGVRLQIAPSAESKIPVLYGSAFFGGNINDAAMTNANKTMWYSIVLSEKVGTKIGGGATTYTFRNIYWNDQRIVFNSDGITVNYTVDRSGNIDRSLSGLVRIYCYRGNSTAGVVPSGYTGTVPNATTLFPNWSSGTHPMTDLIFALVRVDYNREKNVTGLGNMLFHVENDMFQPGNVLNDYLTNTRYGAGIAASDVDVATLTALNTYSAENLAYDDQGTGFETLEDRYQINGLLDTAVDVKTNIEKVCNAAASWLSYDITTGLWGVIINKAGTSVASFDDNEILGTIDISGTGLQDLYNNVKVEFPHRELRDSGDFVNIELDEEFRNANEEDNTLNISYDIINEPIQAQLLGFIELKQSRVDLIINFQADYTVINLKAGDIIDVTNSRFGFNAKLFRIISISEIHDDGGALMVDITALEYDANVYLTDDLFRFTRTDTNGIITIGSIGQPGIPLVSKIERDARPRIIATSTSPTGIVEGMEFWLTTDVSASESARSYTLIATRRPVGGGVYTSGTVVELDYDNLGETNFLIKTRGFNTTTVGPFSDPSGSVFFAPVQITDGIGPDTQAFDATGGLLTSLALSLLISKLGDLMGSDAAKSIFDKVFETFEDVTGVDLLGDASDGSLVVSADLSTKADGTNVSATTSSLDFVGPITATGSGANTVKLADGTKDKQILAWNADERKWQTISDCISCDFENIPPPVGPAETCSLEIKSTLPVNNFSLGDLCKAPSTVPSVGSYFIKYDVYPGSDPAEAILSTAITLPAVGSVGIEYTIAKSGNTDFTWFGASNNTVGTKFKTRNPAELYPAGKHVSQLIAGSRYIIKTVKSASDQYSAAQTKAQWEAIGWVGATPTANPAIGDAFTATGPAVCGTGGSGTVDRATDSTGWVYPRGARYSGPPPIPSLVRPIQPGTGNFYLYGTDGKLEQTLPVNKVVCHGDIAELPFAPRQPGKDYYVTADEGALIACGCESLAINDPTTWTFTTSLTPLTAYARPAAKQFTTSGGDTVLNRQDLTYIYSPLGTSCSTNQDLIFRFNTKVKKGTGSVTVKDRMTGSIIATKLVSSATITERLDVQTNQPVEWIVNFGSITGLTIGKFYDVTAPRGLLLSENTVIDLPGECYDSDADAPYFNRRSQALTWGFKADEPLRVSNYEVCYATNGNPTLNSNIILTFNKPIRVKADKPAFVEIYSSSGLHQKIDLRGTFAADKYGNIYLAGDSFLVDDPCTAENDISSNIQITLNPTNPFKGNTKYYINIASGVIIDATCDLAWGGISDQNTVTWTTDGIAASPPQQLTPGSLYFDFDIDRPILPGYGKIIMRTPDGRLKTTVGINDLAVKTQENVPFGFVQTIPGITRIRPFAAIKAMGATLTAQVDNVKYADIAIEADTSIDATFIKVKLNQVSVGSNFNMNIAVIRNVGDLEPTALITTATLRL